MMAKTLLEKALQTNVVRNGRHQYSKEELEVIEAWLSGEVTLTQIMKTLDKSSGYVYVWIALGARQYFQGMK